MVFINLLSVTLAWGVLSFGAVYPWGYWPLVGACAVLGGAGLASAKGIRSNATPRGLTIMLVVIGALVLLQLVPLSQATIQRVSPATDAFLRRYDLAYATSLLGGILPTHPISIRPQNTWVGFAFLAGFGALLLGTTRMLSRVGTGALVRRLILLGCIVATIGIVHKASGSRKVYGFWQPYDWQDIPSIFGPFVNRNHYAGWMMMTLSLAFGYLAARASEAEGGRTTTGLRERILWLASAEASRLVAVALALFVMGLSLVFTMSRAGIAGLAVSVVVMGWAIVRKQTGAVRRGMIVAYLASLMVVALGWVGVEAIGARFAAVPGSSFGDRLGPWHGALTVIRDFPLVGTGLGTFAVAMLVYQPLDVSSYWSFAHNDYLQLVADGGLLLGVPSVVALALFVREIRRRFQEGTDDPRTYWTRVGAVTALITIGLQELVDFSLEIPGNTVLFAVVAAIAMHRPAARHLTRAASPPPAKLRRSLRGRPGPRSV
ncbi:MAG: O-antigen ligase family protein [Acidobacteria bacterium]|nr:O-antigen ligase family protein [Acidobacteriota bacterium]